MEAESVPRASSRQAVGVGAVLLLVVAAQHRLSPSLRQDQLQTWSAVFLGIVIQSTPFLVGGVLLSAAIATRLPLVALQRWMPRNPVLAVPVAGLAGIGPPGCECAAVPIAGSLIRRGVAPSAVLTFMLAAPAVNPVVIVSTAIAFPGRPAFVLARFSASLLTSVIVGWWCLWRGTRPSPVVFTAHHDHGFLDTVRHDFLNTGGYLVGGAMLAASVNTFVPRSVLDHVSGQVVLGVVTLAAFAFVVSLCSESDAFVAASFTTFSDTARLAFLVVGPAMDLRLATMETGAFGRAFTVRFVPIIFLTSLTVAVLVARVLL